VSGEHLAGYLLKLAKLRKQVEATPELSLREPLLALVRELAQAAGRSQLLIAPEADAGQAGQPDIFVKDGPRLVGFIETKAPGTDLGKWLRQTKQGRRYRESLPNWVATDYYRFVFVRDGTEVTHLEIADPTGAAQSFEPDSCEQLQQQFTSFFAYAPPFIRSPKRLALELSRRARLLRDGIEGVLHAEPENGRLRSVHAFYRQTLMSDLDEESFADTFAQTIAYGLFLARLRESEGAFTLNSATAAIPESVPFLRSAVRLLTDEDVLPGPVKAVLADLLAMLDNTNIDNIRKEVAAGGLEHDLVVYFYERFLEQYDAGERKKRGVYYTPPELVGYLIRATQKVLEQDFALPKGLADESVTLLDPAVGTGTSGGVVFTTIQKFLPGEKGDRHPVLSERRNVVVIADEAHRSQYDFVDGFARHMRDALPNASFIGFTGTPIERADASTRAVFGDTISVYDIQRAVLDGATVPIFYESRLAKLDLDPAARPKLDADFDEVTEGEEVERAEKLKSKWGRLEALVGAEARLELIARDLVGHFEGRLEGMEGKAMVVCMSRRICVDLFAAIAALRPEWAGEDGSMKVVMTGSASDPVEWQQHIRSKARREELANRFRDPADTFRVVIVRDMWLTGFDAPSLHTMYVDKPMRGPGLMQAIARVNRVFRDKPGGLVVDYLGLAEELKQALATYTESGGEGSATHDQAEAIALMLEKHDVCCAIFHGFDRSGWLTGTAAERLSLLPAAQEHVLAQEDGKERFLQAVTELSKAFALAVPSDEALAIRDDVAFFQAVRSALAKKAAGERPTDEDLDHAVRQILSRAIVSDEVVDVFAAAGLDKPDISILSDEFLAEVRGLPQRNLAVELLRKLLSGEIRTRSRRNVVQARRFSELLEQALRRYQNRAIEAAQVIEELIALAKEMREADRRGDELGLDEAEVAFYDALETNDSAVAVLGDETLREIARELVAAVRANVTIDWAVRENVRAQLRVIVKRILRKHGYPPDKQEQATATVHEQAEALGLERVEEAARDVPPFVRVPADEVEPYVNAIPLYSLAVAAGGFGDGRAVEPEAWVEPRGRVRPGQGLFVAQVVGESMNRRIPNGAFCVWRAAVGGARTGRVVLVESRGISDPETGGSYTVKIYDRISPERVRLVPDSTDARFAPIELVAESEADVRVVAELVEVLSREE
jgi:phage repressor protein C with HTH and peptisase S24 domain